MFKMRSHRLSENGLLQVLSLTDQVFDSVPVTDSGDVLGDNRALIKRRGHVVRRRTNHLDSSCVGLVVRASTRKGRQKAVMNVDDRDAGF